MIKSARERLAYINKCKSELEQAIRDVEILKKDIKHNTCKALEEPFKEALKKSEEKQSELQHLVFSGSASLVVDLLEIHFNKQLTQEERQWTIIREKYKVNLIDKFDMSFQLIENIDCVENYKREFVHSIKQCDLYKIRTIDNKKYLDCVKTGRAYLRIPYEVIENVQAFDEKLSAESDKFAAYADEARTEQKNLKLTKLNKIKEKRRQLYEELKKEFEA